MRSIPSIPTSVATPPRTAEPQGRGDRCPVALLFSGLPTIVQSPRILHLHQRPVLLESTKCVLLSAAEMHHLDGRNSTSPVQHSAAS